MTSTLQHKGRCTKAYFNSQMGVCKKAHNELQSELGKLVWFYNAAFFNKVSNSLELLLVILTGT